MKSTEERFEEWFNNLGESFVKLLQTEAGHSDPEIIKLQLKLTFIEGSKAGLEQGREIFTQAVAKL